MSIPYEFYKNKIEENKRILNDLEKILVIYSIIRLVIVTLCIAVLYFQYKVLSFSYRIHFLFHIECVL